MNSGLYLVFRFYKQCAVNLFTTILCVRVPAFSRAEFLEVGLLVQGEHKFKTLIDTVQLCSKAILPIYAHEVFCPWLGGWCGLRADVSQREEGVGGQARPPQISTCHPFLTIRLTDSYPPEAGLESHLFPLLGGPWRVGSRAFQRLEKHREAWNIFVFLVYVFLSNQQGKQCLEADPNPTPAMSRVYNFGSVTEASRLVFLT